MTKTCSVCREELPQADFGPDKRKRDGLNGSCRACVKIYNKAWRGRHPEAVSSYRQRWIDGDGAEYMRQWRADHTEERAAYLRAWHSEHPGYSTEMSAKWMQENPVRAKVLRAEHNNLRRRRIGSGRVTATDYLAILEEFNGGCAYCAAPYEHWDHYIPLARGGKHEAANLVPACKACNLNKRAMLPIWEWVGTP